MPTHLDAVPVLAGEGVLGLLLEALLALGQSLVPVARVSAIRSPPGAETTARYRVQSLKKSISLGRNVLANSHLDEQRCQRRDRMCCLVSDGDRAIEVTKFGVSSLESKL